MYLVRWTDREGNLKERTFGASENARLEADRLRKDSDFVEVICANGKRVEEVESEANAAPAPVRQHVTLSALLAILPPDIFLTVLHRLGPNALEEASVGTVHQLQNSRCAEVCGDNVVERVSPDDPGPLMLTVTIGGKRNEFLR